jgi:hypothetical protein
VSARGKSWLGCAAHRHPHRAKPLRLTALAAAGLATAKVLIALGAMYRKLIAPAAVH